MLFNTLSFCRDTEGRVVQEAGIPEAEEWMPQYSSGPASPIGPVAMEAEAGPSAAPVSAATPAAAAGAEGPSEDPGSALLRLVRKSLERLQRR